MTDPKLMLAKDYEALTTRLALHRTVLIGIVIGLITVLVAGFMIKHHKDQQTLAQLNVLRDTISRDSLVRDSLVKSTNAAVVASNKTTDTARVVITHNLHDTTWVYDTVNTLMAGTSTDSVKLVQVSHLATSLGDSLHTVTNACTAALNDCDQVKVRLAVEEQAWAKERTDQQTALQKALSLSRHWGLGATCGVAVIRSGAGVGCAAGLTYRR